jgi:ADP-ribose pyrophosphatase YjhB (NUDIX family)
MLAHPDRPGRWEPVNGAMDAGETILDAVLRETREEAGPDVRARPLGVIHAYTFRYDDAVSHMISIAYLCAYEGGEVVPGDDMAGSAVRWWSLSEIEAEQPTIVAPGSPDLRWLLPRAVELYRELKDRPPAVLQPDLSSMKNKYER